MVASSNSQLQSMLQRAVQTVQWTYCLFWKLCPRQRILVWSDGYYNGAIKTRKTVQPMEVSAEEESLQRSQQLRELYDALSAGETNQQARRPSAALCPGDLTESEWFYLMCVSFSFPPGVGLPGRAYAKRQHVWLTGANEVDSKFFTRAILAKSASVQTVVCIPLLDGVVELGTVERVEEDVGFIRQIKSIFNISNIDQQHEEAHLQVPMPALSEHSTSNNNPLPANSSTSGAILQQRRNAYTSSSPINTNTINTTAVPAHQNQDHPHTDIEEDQDLELEEDEDNDEDDDDDDDDHEADSDADINNNNNCSVSVSVRSENPYSNVPEVEPRELMQLDDMSEDIRVGSPDDGSNNLDSSDDHRPQSHILPPTNSQTGNRDTQQRLRGRRVEDFSRSGSSYRWPRIEDNPAPAVLGNEINSLEPPPMSSSGATPFGLDDDEFAQEDTHYSQTVSTILQHQFSRYSETLPNMAAFLTYSAHSAFCKWSLSSHDHLRSSSQWTLKYILFTVPFLHSKSGHDQETASSMFKSREITTDSVSGRLRKGGTPQEELSANHVLAERRRREKLNERFIVLRSLVPFVTKMDKASILGDTIEYVKQLRKKIQELEARTREMEADHGQSRIVGDAMKKSSSVKEQRNKMARGVDRRKMRILKGSGGGGGGKQGMVEEGIVTKLEVSIIESDGLVQLQCPHREGLLLDMMQVLRELRVEITAIQSSLNNGIFVAELKAKVKEDNNNKGKKATIMEVKRAIHQIIPH